MKLSILKPHNAHVVRGPADARSALADLLQIITSEHIHEFRNLKLFCLNSHRFKQGFPTLLYLLVNSIDFA